MKKHRQLKLKIQDGILMLEAITLVDAVEAAEVEVAAEALVVLLLKLKKNLIKNVIIP